MIIDQPLGKVLGGAYFIWVLMKLQGLTIKILTVAVIVLVMNFSILLKSKEYGKFVFSQNSIVIIRKCQIIFVKAVILLLYKQACEHNDCPAVLCTLNVDILYREKYIAVHIKLLVHAQYNAIHRNRTLSNVLRSRS